MGFDRVRIKEEAKTRMREARPRPWQVTLAYMGVLYLITVLLLVAFFLFVDLLSSSHSFHGPSTTAIAPLLFLYLAALVPIALLQAGYCLYSLRLWRKEPSGYQDLWKGFSMMSRVLALWGLLFLLSILWCLPFFAVGIAAALLSRSSIDPALQDILLFFAAIAAYAFIISRSLLYTLSFHVLLDHPDHTARQALRESKALIKGQRWSLCLFFLSFIGWYLLEYVIIYAASMGISLLVFTAAFAAPYILSSPSAIYVLFFLILFVVLIAALPLLLWLIPYMNVSLAGIYDCLQGKPLIPPAPPWAGPSSPIPFGD